MIKYEYLYGTSKEAETPNRPPDIEVTSIQKDSSKWKVWVKEGVMQFCDTEGKEEEWSGYFYIGIEEKQTKNINSLHPLDKAYLEFKINKAIEDALL